MKQDYKQALMDACLAVKPTRGNYSGTAVEVASEDEPVFKAALPPHYAQALTNIATKACDTLAKIKGRTLTEEEVKDVIYSLV